MSSKPTIIFVPGAWHGPEAWSKLAPLLETHSHKCIAIELPSTLSNRDATFSQDVHAVRQAIESETTQGHDVLLVCHSFGGAVGPSAIKGFTRPKDQAQPPTTDGHGHVLGLVMITTGFLPTGLGFLEAFGGDPPPIWTLNQETGYADITVDPRELFYHDLPQEEGAAWVAKLRDQAFKTFQDGTDAYAGWLDVPVWYLVATEDRALPAEAQRALVQMAREAGAEVTVREVEASHSPMLSKPEETVGVILEAVGSVVGGSKDV